MKCKGCPHFKDDDCNLAKEGKVGEMEGDCLLRAILVTLGQNMDFNGTDDFCDGDEGEAWKLGIK